MSAENRNRKPRRRSILKGSRNSIGTGGHSDLGDLEDQRLTGELPNVNVNLNVTAGPSRRVSFGAHQVREYKVQQDNSNSEGSQTSIILSDVQVQGPQDEKLSQEENQSQVNPNQTMFEDDMDMSDDDQEHPIDFNITFSVPPPPISANNISQSNENVHLDRTVFGGDMSKPMLFPTEDIEEVQTGAGGLEDLTVYPLDDLSTSEDDLQISQGQSHMGKSRRVSFGQPQIREFVTLQSNSSESPDPSFELPGDTNAAAGSISYSHSNLNVTKFGEVDMNTSFGTTLMNFNTNTTFCVGDPPADFEDQATVFGGDIDCVNQNQTAANITYAPSPLQQPNAMKNYGQKAAHKNTNSRVPIPRILKQKLQIKSSTDAKDDSLKISVPDVHLLSKLAATKNQKSRKQNIFASVQTPKRLKGFIQPLVSIKPSTATSVDNEKENLEAEVINQVEVPGDKEIQSNNMMPEVAVEVQTKKTPKSKGKQSSSKDSSEQPKFKYSKMTPEVCEQEEEDTSKELAAFKQVNFPVSHTPVKVLSKISVQQQQNITVEFEIEVDPNLQKGPELTFPVAHTPRKFTPKFSQPNNTLDLDAHKGSELTEPLPEVQRESLLTCFSAQILSPNDLRGVKRTDKDSTLNTQELPLISNVFEVSRRDVVVSDLNLTEVKEVGLGGETQSKLNQTFSAIQGDPHQISEVKVQLDNAETSALKEVTKGLEEMEVQSVGGGRKVVEKSRSLLEEVSMVQKQTFARPDELNESEVMENANNFSMEIGTDEKSLGFQESKGPVGVMPQHGDELQNESQVRELYESSDEEGEGRVKAQDKDKSEVKAVTKVDAEYKTPLPKETVKENYNPEVERFKLSPELKRYVLNSASIRGMNRVELLESVYQEIVTFTPEIYNDFLNCFGENFTPKFWEGIEICRQRRRDIPVQFGAAFARRRGYPV